MQTTLTHIYDDIYAELGLLGIIAVITAYFMLAERGVFPKFWMKGVKDTCDPDALAVKLHTNHIPHIEAQIAVIDTKIDNLGDKIDEVKKSAHARMDRMEKRMD